MKLGYLDITFHRDDYRERLVMPEVRGTNIQFSIDDKIVIGILHKPSICNNTKMSFVNNHPITGKQCLIRNSKIE